MWPTALDVCAAGKTPLGNTASRLHQAPPTNRVSKQRIRAQSAGSSKAGFEAYDDVASGDRVLMLLGAILENQEKHSKKTPFEEKDSSDRILTMLDGIHQQQSILQGTVQQQMQTLVARLDGAMQQEQAEMLKVDKSLVNMHVAEEALVSQFYNADSGGKPANNYDTGAGEQSENQGQPHGESAQRTSVCSTSSTMTRKPEKPKSLVGRILLNNYFECFMALVIVANMFLMFISIQLKGMNAGFKMGVAEDDGSWDTHKVRFDVIEQLLNVIYVVELLMQLWVFKIRFFKEKKNWLDLFIVLSSCVEIWVFQPLSIEVINLSVLRLFRLTRIFRLAHVLRSSPMFSELRVLIRTLGIAVKGVVWSIFLLSFIIVIGGILMAQCASMFLDDETIELERRQWLYQNFGTTWASMYTMFECTFTGAWRFYSRPLVEEVSYLFAFFWIFWVILVNFTTMKVIGALFLKDTMAVSARDAENCAISQLKNKGTSAEKLRAVFNEADTSGDGCISKAEFNLMMQSEDVIEDFASLGLDPDEVTSFFTVLSADDGTADYNEFISGALGMASSAPTLDRLKAMQGQIKIEVMTKQNNMLLSRVCEHLKLPTD